MSRIYKEREVPAQAATTKKYLDKIVCDFCGKKAHLDDYNSGRVSGNIANWDNQNAYEFENIIIQKEVGSRYPDTSWGEVESWDICPDCFEKYIKPILPKDSYKHEWDY